MSSCTGFIQPLDLQCLFVNMFAGSAEIFMFISFIVIASLGAYFRMLNTTLLIIFVLYALFFGNLLSGITFFILLIVGLVTATLITRLVKN